MAAPCTTAGGASATGGTRRGRYGPAAGSLADKSAGRHELRHLFAAAGGAFGFMGTKDQAFKILTAFFAVILIDWHSTISLLIRINPLPMRFVQYDMIFSKN